MEECAEKYGDIFTLRVSPVFKPQVFISNPQAIQQIFTSVKGRKEQNQRVFETSFSGDV
jgi:cytochrome P450